MAVVKSRSSVSLHYTLHVKASFSVLITLASIMQTIAVSYNTSFARYISLDSVHTVLQINTYCYRVLYSI